ncbi:MAG: hypothetical protein K2M36_04820, partial [Clostridia bacterium]|nr:hypothetical protein [Clostridia bacterium]
TADEGTDCECADMSDEAKVQDRAFSGVLTQGNSEECDKCKQSKTADNPLNDKGEAVDDVSANESVCGVKNGNQEQTYGKFKNPQELLKAYGELEKEFTRRSQRLKELESGKQPVKSEEDWKCAVDKFFNQIPAAKAFAKDIANEIIKNPELKEDANCLNVALVRVLADKFRTPEQLMQDGQFLNDYVLSSEKVRDAIIADYLDGVRGGMPPHTLSRGGLQCVAPKVKPRTIEEAGFMFLKNNK